MTNLETIYRKLTRCNPRTDIQPPLIGARLAREVKKIRTSTSASVDIFQRIEVVGYEILESGVEAQEQYTLVGRRFKDGRLEAAFVFGACLKPEHVTQYAQNIPPEFWVSYTSEEWQ